ncbi:hypothetical protein DL771_004087 [Monosporascus sp. 5C6A]|nr:hypothetical protein DL771_004087 [Monosporascus sp. 5C6A]
MRIRLSGTSTSLQGHVGCAAQQQQSFNQVGLFASTYIVLSHLLGSLLPRTLALYADIVVVSLIVAFCPADISSFVDDFVETWKKENPGLGSSEPDKVLATANTVKAALLNPSFNSKRTAVPPPLPHPPRHVPLYRRQLANSTLSTNSTLEEARALVSQAQKEANLRSRERFQNPRLNTYYGSFSPAAAVKARAADVAALTVNETVAAAAAQVAEADAVNEEPASYQSLPEEILLLKSQVQGSSSNEDGQLTKRATSGFWKENMSTSAEFRTAVRTTTAIRFSAT